MSEDLFFNSNSILQSDFGVAVSATLMKGFYFLNGDENFYKFIGKNSGLSLPELLWDEDVASFVEALENLKHGPQVFMARVKGGDDSYYSLILMMGYNGKTVEDFKMIDVDMLDFQCLKQRYNNYIANTKKFASIFSLLPQVFIEYTMSTDVLVAYKYINQKPTILFNEKLKEFMEKALYNGLFTQEDKIAFYNLYENLKDDGERFEATISAKVVATEDSEGTFKFKCSSFYEGGVKTKKVGIIERDKQSSRKIKYYLTENAYDTGTGLFNKRAINEYALDKLSEANLTGKPLYLAIIDIDDFKHFNDTYGHMFGDEVLSKIADIIRQDLNFRGCCGRIGGDEYMIIFDQVDDEEALRNIIKTIRKNIAFAFINTEQKVEVTTSWGISKFPDDGRKFDELFEKADKSLYIAKEKGKDRFIIYREDKHSQIAVTDTEKRRVGFHNLVKPAEKGKVVTKLLLKLNEFSPDKMPEILDTIREYFDVDGIAVYKGENLDRIYEAGKYVEPIQQLSFARKEEYQELFDSNGMFSEMVMARMKGILGNDYKKLEKQEIGRFIQVKAGKDENMTIVSFDFFNRAPKVGETDYSFIGIVGAFMANIISRN